MSAAPSGAQGRRGRAVVAVIDAIDPLAERRLADRYDVIHPDGVDADAVRAALAHASGAIVRTTPLRRAVLETANELRVIAKHGIGVDNIDIAYAHERRIVVTRTGSANTAAVAEFTLAAILLACKPLLAGATWLRRGSAKPPLVVAAQRAGLVGRELSEVVVGVVGWGAIGRRVGMSVATLGGSVVAYDPFVSQAQETLAVRFVDDLETLLRATDVLTVHVPLTTGTRGMIGSSELALMKPGGALVNTSRGGVVDEAALADAIIAGHVRTAVIDVFEREPPAPEDRLLQLEQVVCTPHIAGSTSATLRRMGDAAVDALIAVLTGNEPADVVNPQAP